MEIKIQQLIESGLSPKFLKNLSEGQINQLHIRMISEQPQPQTITKTVKQVVLPPGSETTVGNVSVSTKGGKTTVTPTTETEIGEDTNIDAIHDPDATEDGMGMFETEIGEGKKKNSKYNPWAICTASVGRDDKKKYEKCVMDVKRNIREGKNPYQVIVEMSLEKMVEKHVSPRMTKGDLLNTLSEQGIIRRPMKNMAIGFGEKKMDKPVGKSYTSKKEAMEQQTKEAPAPTRVKPGTKEREKPGKMDPFKNPKHQPKPKAKKDIEEQATKTAPAPTITKPGTKEKPGTSDPFKNPKHQPKPKALDKPAKKMGTVKIPDYLTFDQLKINFKNQ